MFADAVVELARALRDVDDIESILESGVTLDESYVAHWAALWEVEERWAALRSQRR